MVFIFDRFVLKPFCLSVNKLCLSRNKSICVYSKCSIILPGRGSKEIGLRSSGPFTFDTLRMGIMVADFHFCGKTKLLKISDLVNFVP